MALCRFQSSYCVTEDLLRQTITLLLTSTRILIQVRYGIIFHTITNNVNHSSIPFAEHNFRLFGHIIFVIVLNGIRI